MTLPSLELLLAGALVTSLVIYALTGGADFGAGLWSIWGRDDRASRRRKLIDHAIGPIWEAHHVWLILVVTILFTGFPRAFAVMSTSLHLPLTALVIGIVLRGSAFVFRNDELVAGREEDGPSQLWGRLFAWSSMLAPVMLGTTIGAVASGRLIPRSQTFYDAYVATWLAPFPLLVGCFALGLFAYLAALYLIFETPDRDLQDDFRVRALAAWSVVAVLGIAILLLSKKAAPEIYGGLVRTTWGHVTLASAAVAGFAGLFTLWRRLYGMARIAAVLLVAVILFGWALSQYPYVIVPSLTLDDAAAPPSTLRLLLWSLVAGAFVLFPSLAYLYSVFKSHALFSSATGDEEATCPPSDKLSN
jgi:cytochrome d ubiquinol oxidase subunit II